ncbi:hypothetical protein AOQ84DRAFT_354854 [Glonium stellatum]|uniref:Uncharacterized protein n=1 Tax=Glonium stellatum TaxID=574774 RepID=A0A8E2F003_9PEZI|nr:hypothetical protein AOQ84DRAFT_354854 [Glonium stellatum]
MVTPRRLPESRMHADHGFHYGLQELLFLIQKEQPQYPLFPAPASQEDHLSENGGRNCKTDWQDTGRIFPAKGNRCSLSWSLSNSYDVFVHFTNVYLYGLGYTNKCQSAMHTALKRLGYRPYHFMEIGDVGNIRERHVPCWRDGMLAKLYGIGKPYRKSELDKLLGRYSV